MNHLSHARFLIQEKESKLRFLMERYLEHPTPAGLERVIDRARDYQAYRQYHDYLLRES